MPRIPIQQKLHEKSLMKIGVQVVNTYKQEQVDKIITRMNTHKCDKLDAIELREIIQELRDDSCQAVILACTDLQLLVDNQDFSFPIIDTCKILEKSVIKKLIGASSQHLSA